MDRSDPAWRWSRRCVLRLAGSVLALPVAVDRREAAAGRSWCRADPVVELRNPEDTRGNNASIYLSARADERELNNSSVDIVVEHPKDAKTNKLWEDKGGYLGQGLSCNFAINERLRFFPTHIQVRVRCYVPAARNDMRIRLEWAPGPVRWDANSDPLPAKVVAAASGYGNRWIALSATLPYADYR